jgi:hypothetical protein
MQSSSVERMRFKRIRHSAPLTTSKDEKLTRRNRRLHRAIKQGEFKADEDKE